jgi:hypothetical protein
MVAKSAPRSDDFHRVKQDIFVIMINDKAMPTASRKIGCVSLDGQSVLSLPTAAQTAGIGDVTGRYRGRQTAIAPKLFFLALPASITSSRRESTTG